MSNSSEGQNLNMDVVLDELPKSSFWDTDIVQWKGFWYWPTLLETAMTFMSSFEARDDDVFIVSSIKTGTTWLKALSLCIMKNRDDSEVDMLTLENPHFHVPTIEAEALIVKPLKVDMYDASVSHLLHTHLPYAVLPNSVKNSACKIVYVARNPKDTLISLWHFFNSYLRPDLEPIPLDKAIDCFCSGEYLYGPLIDHVSEYWVECQRRPDKILFVKYEELKSNPKREVCRIAEFLGRPFRDDGEVEKVLWRCSLERLKSLEVTQRGTTYVNLPNTFFFRKGEVGDWKNHLTSKMEEQIYESIGRKLEALGIFL